MLKYIEEYNEYCSRWEDRDGNDVYLAHGTAKRLVHLSDIDLSDSWYEWRTTKTHQRDMWIASVRDSITWPDEGDEIGWCEDCDEPTLTDELNSVANGDGSVCGGCLDSYHECDRCGHCYDGLTEMEDSDDRWCWRCRDRFASYCEYCDAYFADEHDHSDNCDCESAVMEFQLRNDGLGMVSQDERITVSLPKGELSEQGIEEIYSYLWNLSYELETEERYKLHILNSVKLLSDNIGLTWQTKQGNWTKRLSKYFYEGGVKLPAEVISKVGSIGRQHSEGSDFEIEFTRDLNLSAYAFGNEESCWWQSYVSSRCSLKNNGGFGMRSFSGGDVEGRAWVLPLKLKEDYLSPTFETETPSAFVVFNCYGELHGYAPARIMAHMAGMTYRKISFYAEPMYVNGNTAYLVAPEDLASAYTDSSLNLSELVPHSDLARREQAERKELTNVA